MSGGSAARARLFVALELPGQVRSALVGWAGETLGGTPGVRLLDADSLHMTLCFLGEVRVSAVEGISSALAEACRDGPETPLIFEIEGVRRLPPRRPRVCAVSLRDRDGRGAALQAALSQRLVAGGWYAPERQGWLAHVTVARMSRGGGGPGGSDWSETGWWDAPPPALAPFPATAITLMRSWPGSRYEVLARVASPQIGTET